MDIVVTGGTGRLGRRLTEQLTGAGHHVRQTSRRGAGPGGVRLDLTDERSAGRDLPAALEGADTIVHAASAPRGNPWEADVAGTRRLVQAVDRATLRHLVYVSIVGVDRVPYGYYRAKYATEQVLLASGLPVTIVRITQFHEFVDELLGAARRGRFLPVPTGWRLQPVDTGEAAAHLAAVAGAAPTGELVEFAGPQELGSVDLARAWAARRGDGVRVVPAPVPGKLSAALRDGGLLPRRGARGRVTYAEHLG